MSGIVLKRVPYGDNHLIITFLSEHGRKETVMARNGRKSKKFGAALDLFYENVFIFSQYKGMGQITSVDIVNNHYSLRTNIDVLTYAQYIAELIDRAMEDEEVNEHMYALLKTSLKYLVNGIQPKIIAALVSLKLMPTYGYVPNFGVCLVNQSYNHASFVGYSFKYNCAMTVETVQDDPHVIPMSNKSLYFLYMLYEVPIHQVGNIKIENVILNEMQTLIFKLYDEFTGVYLKSRRIIEQLKL